MPQLIAAALLGAGIIAGLRLVQRWAAAAGAAAADIDRPQSGPQSQIEAKDLGALEFDPKSGVYKPVDRSR